MKEVDAIVQAARNDFAPGTDVFLFGSRLRDVVATAKREGLKLVQA